MARAACSPARQQAQGQRSRASRNVPARATFDIRNREPVLSQINLQQRASLRLPKLTADFSTVREAVEHWHKLDPYDRDHAVLSLADGTVFQPSEVADLNSRTSAQRPSRCAKTALNDEFGAFLDSRPRNRLASQISLEGTMDDKDKSIFESVTDTIKNTIDIATEAAKRAMEPEPIKVDEEVVMIPGPESADPMSPAPPMVAVVKKKPRKKPAVNTSGRITPTYDIPVPDTPLPTPKKAAKKSSKTAKKTAKKAVKKSKVKKAAKKSAPKKSAKKTTKKTAKKSKKAGVKKTTRKTVAKKKKAKKSKR
jgi:hypothetical protein